jgi:heterotetrameric sarcosine oxidase delta subunit
MLLSCPWCGPRELEEFRLRSVVADGSDATARNAPQAFAEVYERTNAPDASIEYWQHDRGCRAWLIVQRDPSTAAVLAVRLLATAVET